MWRWMIPPAAAMPPKKIATGMIARILPGHKCDQDARKAIASVQRRIGLALYRRYFEEAREPRASATNRATSNEELADRQPLGDRNSHIPSGYARREAERRTIDEQEQKASQDYRDDQTPMHSSPGMLPIVNWAGWALLRDGSGRSRPLAAPRRRKLMIAIAM